jgi:hypothetical protein
MKKEVKNFIGGVLVGAGAFLLGSGIRDIVRKRREEKARQ